MIINNPVFHERKIIRLSAERIYHSQTTERFKIIGHDRTIIVENDLPALRTRKRKGEIVNWKVVSGEIKNLQVYKKVLQALEMKIPVRWI
jgi:hypothetical protein